ncbi:MAG: NAD-dependent epimerase/dehydratase family protein [Opitutales bacterium]|nr:NAD-dependent epimerase/dehydratase family protein [Opitutales bacterium]
MKALLTGGGGFLGRYLVDAWLKQGHEVAILGRTEHPDLVARGIDFHQGDLSELETVRKACEGCEVVFHTAAKAGVWGAKGSFWMTNFQGTQNVITACREQGVQRLIHTSTPSVVFNRQPLRGVDESQPYGSRWLCHYAESKAAAEKEVLAAHAPGQLQTVALRPHLIWGKGDNHLIPRVVARARAGKLKIVGTGTNKVDLVHVRNAAAAHLLAEEKLRDTDPVCGGKSYFITQGQPVVLWDWINALLKKLDIPPVTRKVPLPVAYTAGALLEAVYAIAKIPGEPPMTRFVATELAKDHYFDISAARRDLGYNPRFSEEEGLRELVEELRKLG